MSFCGFAARCAERICLSSLVPIEARGYASFDEACLEVD